MMSGQAAVAVAVSGVQVLSAAASLWGLPREAISAYVSDGSAEERSAFIFFGLSTMFLIASVVTHGWLISMPVYKTIAAPLEQQSKDLRDGGERQGLVSSGPTKFSDEKGRILRIAKANITYEFAVAYVFMVTLVRRHGLLYSDIS